ncbi:hypothetical protein GCM10009069_28440 [Algimonas arctica]|uniref:DUF4440 domain-containing protein n=1 Tax=Algimonas arctica TaxID=1479486 RepID=A0A8J3CV33_9PROT|nr:hypothetical protein [Algimonas arctica]GHB04216.1 hypothetical protein GCM10009069_28440 [Algimonas arctica]
MKSNLLIKGAVASLALCLTFFGMPSQSMAQAQQAQTQQTQRPALPDENTQARLVWSTLIALDNANRTGNYEVLHSLGTDGFQRQNSPGRLSQSFAQLRQNRVDVGRSILSSPTYYQPPTLLPDGSLRLRGGFDFRPKSIRFDLIYVSSGGGWQINALSIVEMDFDAPR